MFEDTASALFGVQGLQVTGVEPASGGGIEVWAGWVAISAASDTRVLWPPVTITTGVWPRPQVRPFGGLSP